MFILMFPSFGVLTCRIDLFSTDAMQLSCKQLIKQRPLLCDYANLGTRAHHRFFSLQIFGGPGLSPGLSAWMVDVSHANSLLVRVAGLI
jgi:hypothetical protein